MNKSILFATLTLTFLSFTASAQKQKKEQNKTTSAETKKGPLENESTFSAFKWRSIGPATTSGRVIDIAVNPKNKSQYYVAAASGGVWKTINNGITYEPIFDSEGSYSIGCIEIDPENPNVIWVGSGENNNQRSVSYGDGLYK